jgi:hypothetical protein
MEPDNSLSNLENSMDTRPIADNKSGLGLPDRSEVIKFLLMQIPDDNEINDLCGDIHGYTQDGLDDFQDITDTVRETIEAVLEKIATKLCEPDSANPFSPNICKNAICRFYAF